MTNDSHEIPEQLWGHPAAEFMLEGVGIVFNSFGRALICLGPDFRVVHASLRLADLPCPEESSQAILGRRADEIFGRRLFGDEGVLRRALSAGERREGWGAQLRLPGEPACEVSISVAPLGTHSEICDPRVAYFVMVRPHGGEDQDTPRAPTVFCGMLARSASMLRIFQLIEHLRESDATVLVTGESGTGKELVARAIHRYSPRSTGSFVAVNCGALPDQLLESELFGHVRGSFTGAVRDRTGRFELAAGGTIFLDEIGDLPLHLQVKLLRVLQERTFERVGESRSHSSDARVIAATHHDLHRAVLEGRFRDDLFYRLRVVPVEVPPLRRRREDVEPLAEHLLERVSAHSGRALRFAPDVIPALLRYDWPGNVRELENALEFACAVCRGQTIHLKHLPPEMGGEHPSAPAMAAAMPPPAAPLATSSSSPKGDERSRLEAALDEHHWRRDATARALGMSRTTLWRKMRELGLLE